ncbi:MAG: uracil-DNA glycosylase [Bacteroidales bacterium]|nr:uracil-DNA glycosylase [Bacteroidales bacterium]MCF8332971.1 uracil-DNA glycosylase [Bacteroidales bacterium]
MSKSKIDIAKSWQNLLEQEFQSAYFQELQKFLTADKKKFNIYPSENEIFAAFDAVPFEKVKVVILGQDPYHGARQANGLSFSVRKGMAVPPSLKNIFKELHNDLGIPVPSHGDLSKWASQGVFLLNAVLTVRESRPRSHQEQGWEHFTDNVIRILSKHRHGLIFLLWGRHARRKQELINTEDHFVLQAPHPSPFSAYKGFFGCRHFSETNKILRNLGEKPIDWQIGE